MLRMASCKHQDLHPVSGIAPSGPVVRRAMERAGAGRLEPQDGHGGWRADGEPEHDDHSHGPSSSTAATDPVCGMSVEPAVARARGLQSRHADVDYFFCGRGCKLDFDEDPERYLAPGYVPSM
jgi:YHS domain-containing protein